VLSSNRHPKNGDLNPKLAKKRVMQSKHASVIGDILTYVDFAHEIKLMHRAHSHKQCFTARGRKSAQRRSLFIPTSGDITVLNKNAIMLAVAAALGFATAAIAYEDPENQIGDRYPFLAPAGKQVLASKMGYGSQVRVQVSYSNPWASEEPENRIGDRYPVLADAGRPVRASVMSNVVRTRMQAADASPSGYEDPENRIGDRYPMLAQAAPRRGVGTFATAGRGHRQAKKPEA
jgi:hypothetical protein